MASRDRFLRPLYRFYEGRLERDLDPGVVPQHIGIILDGHRRYARSEGLPDYTAAYKVGMRKFEQFLGWSYELHVPAITGWLLSTHNLHRPAEELDPYFEVLIDLFDRLPVQAREQDLAIRFIGSLDLLPGDLVESAKRLEERCSSGSRRVTIALAYGGRQEIVDAVKDLVADLADEGVSAQGIADHIDKHALSSRMYASDLPDPDMV